MQKIARNKSRKVDFHAQNLTTWRQKFRVFFLSLVHILKLGTFCYTNQEKLTNEQKLT